MSITELSVKKPVAVIMLVIFAIVFGIFGYTQLGASLYPPMDIPVVSISTTYSGASVDEIEEKVVKPIEEKVSGISGIDTITSTSQQGSGSTMIQFTTGTNLDAAFMDVQQALSDVSNRLPKDADKPIIRKFDPDASAVITLAISGSAPYEQLYDEADKISQSVQKLKGVGNVSVTGGKTKAVMIKLDKTAMDYYGLTVSGISSKIAADNTNPSVGTIMQDSKTQSIRVLGEYQSVEEIKNIVVSSSNGATIHLGEVANISLDYPTPSKFVRFNNNTSVGVEISKQSDANVVETIKLVKSDLETFKKTAPKGVEINIASDDSTTIDATLNDVKRSLVEGIITTSIVMFLFLRQLRASIIVLVAIPTSLITTFFCMYVAGFTLNSMSLIALSLCIGILVDDSIVVLENIQRHLKMGKSLFHAAIDGRNEVGMAAISITLCDVVVFIPIAFISGTVGSMMRQFALTIVFATLISLLVSFTVTPMLASKLLVPEKKEKKKGKFDEIGEKFTGKYRSFLVWCLDNRIKLVAITLALFIASITLVTSKIIPFEYMPKSDQSRISVSVELKPGSTAQQADEKVKLIENYLKNVKEVKTFYTSVGSSQAARASITVNLVPMGERKKTQTDIANEARKFVKTIPGANISVSESSGFGMGGGSGKPITMKVKGPDFDKAREIATKVEEIIKSVQGTSEVATSVDTSQQELDIRIDRIAAAQYGVAPSDIANTLRVAGKDGSTAGVYRENGDEYNIVLMFQDKQVVTNNDIGELKMTNSQGQKVAINQVAKLLEEDSPQRKQRENREAIISVSANVSGRALGEVDSELKGKLAQISLPDNYELQTGGDQKSMADTNKSMAQAMITAVFLVYTILVILYESFSTPVLRMITLPCAIIGSLGILALTKTSLNMTTMIGFVMLDGLVAKNGTLLIDYTNTLMHRGMNLREALVEAGLKRIKPIIMTSATMIVGMIPSAVSKGEGASLKSGMAMVIIGGMIASTILSPIIIPVCYTLLDDFKGLFRGKKKVISVNE